MDYKSIGINFSKVYYDTYDANINNIKQFFSQQCKITCFDKEFLGFDSFLQHMATYNINTFSHKINSVIAQPNGNLHILIVCHGTLVINNSMTYNFSDVFLLNKLFTTNTYEVDNMIFSIL